MTSSTSNIEAVARGICSKQLSRHGSGGAKLAAYIDRYMRHSSIFFPPMVGSPLRDLVRMLVHDRSFGPSGQWPPTTPSSRAEAPALTFAPRNEGYVSLHGVIFGPE